MPVTVNVLTLFHEVCVQHKSCSYLDRFAGGISFVCKYNDDIGAIVVIVKVSQIRMDLINFVRAVYTNRSKTLGLETQYKRRKTMFLFNDAINTFYLRLYGVGHMVKNHSDSER